MDMDMKDVVVAMVSGVVAASAHSSSPPPTSPPTFVREDMPVTITTPPATQTGTAQPGAVRMTMAVMMMAPVS